MNQSVIINSRKFDGTIHRSWKAELIEETFDFWVFAGEFEKEIRHPELGVIRPGTVSYEYYWKQKWYNVFRFHEPEGTLRNFYCNINQPPQLSEGVLDYVDLDIDVLVWGDFSFEILDLDEFEQNSKLYGYTENLVLRCRETLVELQELIAGKGFPFSEW